MTINIYNKLKKKIYLIGAIFFITTLIISGCASYQSQQDKIETNPPKGSAVGEKQQNIDESSDKSSSVQPQGSYKIENGICYVSYDNAKTWKKVPVNLEALVDVGDGKANYSQLQPGSYLITPQKTSFVYGGTKRNNLFITYTDDMGATWITSEISTQLNSTRLRFCSFPTVSVGYVIATGGRTMSQERQFIYQTTDGGVTWQEVGYGPRTSLLQTAGFVDEKVGFMIYPKIEGAETNFYRTEDGGKTFDTILLPVVQEEWMGSTIEPFILPEVPYQQNGMLFLLVGQGELGDFKGGTVMAKYKSNDWGKTWSFVQLVEPPSKEQG